MILSEFALYRIALFSTRDLIKRHSGALGEGVPGCWRWQSRTKHRQAALTLILCLRCSARRATSVETTLPLRLLKTENTLSTKKLTSH